MALIVLFMISLLYMMKDCVQFLVGSHWNICKTVASAKI